MEINTLVDFIKMNFMEKGNILMQTVIVSRVNGKMGKRMVLDVSKVMMAEWWLEIGSKINLIFEL